MVGSIPALGLSCLWTLLFVPTFNPNNWTLFLQVFNERSNFCFPVDDTDLQKGQAEFQENDNALDDALVIEDSALERQGEKFS